MIMPKIDGKQLIEFTRKNLSRSHLPIIALSGAMIEHLDRLEQIGADYFLAKGPMEKMAQHIERLLDKIEEGTMLPPSEETVFNPDI
jgi:CheY-like chemotaxis protein